MSTKKPSPLTLAASAFEEELTRYAELTAEIVRLPITSEKSLVRAKKALGETAECQMRLAKHLTGLMQAMDGARQTQQKLMTDTMDAAKQVQQRAGEFAGLMDRFGALGQRAREVNEPVAAVVARKSEGAPPAELLAGLRDVLARLEAIIAEAEGVAGDAAKTDWQDIAREADALKQQMQSARNKLLLAEKSVASHAPS